jgi:hypothetical protein
MDLDQKIELILALTGAAVPLLSIIASLVNQSIRTRQSTGEGVGKAMLSFGAVLNFLSVNLDKALQLIAIARGKRVPETQPASHPAQAETAAPSVSTQTGGACPACGYSPTKHE